MLPAADSRRAEHRLLGRTCFSLDIPLFAKPIADMEDSEAQSRRTSPRKALQVAESKAKRLERQQARFRDRGGIFVPTARNTLADILLGRTAANSSPTRQARARSRSRSPVKPQAKASVSPSKRIAALSVKTKGNSPKKAAVPRKSTGPRAKKPSTNTAEAETIEEVPPPPEPPKLGKSVKKTTNLKKSKEESTVKRSAKAKEAHGKEERRLDPNVAPPEKAEKFRRKAEEPDPKKKASEVTESKTLSTSEPVASEPPEAGTSRPGVKPRAKRTAAPRTKSKQAKIGKHSRSGKDNELEDVDDEVEADQVKKPPPVPKKRTRAKSTHGDDEGDATGPDQSRKKAKASEETAAGKQILESAVASAQPIETSQPDAKPKRRSRKQEVDEHEREETDPRQPRASHRKRAKAVVVEDEPEEDTRPAKRPKTVTKKAKAETSTAKKTAQARKTTTQRKRQESKSGKTSGRSKITGPRKSVMIRMKEPPPPMDDEPDPINFLS